MKSEELFAALREMDEKYVLEAAPGADIAPSDPPNAARRPKSAARARKRTLPIAVAACLCALTLMGAAVLLPMSRKAPAETAGQEPSGALTGPSTPSGTGWDFTPPQASGIPAGDQAVGMQSVLIGEITGSAALSIPEAFFVNIVVEAEVASVYPDVFILPDSQITPSETAAYWVVRLNILDTVRGENLPEEICLRYPASDNIRWSNYDRVILSVCQIGIENFMMIDSIEKEFVYFPNMFQLAGWPGIDGGSAILFQNGQIPDDMNRLPQYLWVGYRCEEVKEILREYLSANPEERKNERFFGIEMWNRDDGPVRYVRSEDFLTSDAARKVWETVRPGASNVFMQDASASSVVFTRIVNGFVTEEKYTLQIGEEGVCVIGPDVVYTEKDLSCVPDIGSVLEQIKPNLANIDPPHLLPDSDQHREPDRESCRFRYAAGFIRKAGDEIVGIVRIVWHDGASYCVGDLFRDDAYILYGLDGVGRVVERDDLRAVIGNDPLILDFEYLP